jgi:hypothetical protein
MRGRFLTRTFSTIMLAFAGALAMATLATSATSIPNLNVTAMPGNEAEDAIAVNPTNPVRPLHGEGVHPLVLGQGTGSGRPGGEPDASCELISVTSKKAAMAIRRYTSPRVAKPETR